MEELKPTWGRVMSVWWLVAWRSAVGALLLGAVAGGVFGSIAALRNWPADSIQTGALILGGVFGVLWAIVVVGMALKKQYSNFRIALVPVTAA